MNTKFLAHVALFLANLIYGINYSVAKDVMPDFIEPFGFILCRVIGAVSFFWICSFLYKAPKIQRSDYLRLVLCGVFGVACNQLCFFEGLNNTTPINASIIMTTNPILVMIIAHFVLKEGITWRKSFGIALGLLGAVTMLLLKADGKEVTIGSTTIYGDCLILLNATSYGIYLVLVKPLMQRYHPMQIIKWVFTFGIVFVTPFGLQQFNQIEWSSFSGVIWAEFAFVVVGVTCLAYLFNIYALKYVNPTVVSTYIYLQPVLASIFALLMQKDSLNGIKIVAAVVIMLGVYLVSSKSQSKLSKNNS